MELTVALAAFGYFRHHERAEDADSARERTEKLLVRALKAGWTRAKLEAEVKRLTRNGVSTEVDPHEAEPGAEPDSTDARTDEARASEAPKRLLFRDKGMQLVLYPINLPQASAADLRGLLERLRTFTTDVEARLASAEGRNHR